MGHHSSTKGPTSGKEEVMLHSGKLGPVPAVLRCASNINGCSVTWWSALFSHSERVPGLNLSRGSFCVESARFPHVCVGSSTQAFIL